MFTFYKQRVLMTLQSVETTSILKWTIVVKGAFSKLDVLSCSLPLSLFDLLHATWWRGYDFFARFARSLLFPFTTLLCTIAFLGVVSSWMLVLSFCSSSSTSRLVFFLNKVWQWLIIVNYCFHFWVNGMVLTFKIIGFNMAWGIKGLVVFTNWIDEF